MLVALLFAYVAHNDPFRSINPAEFADCPELQKIAITIKSGNAELIQKEKILEKIPDYEDDETPKHLKKKAEDFLKRIENSSSTPLPPRK